VTESPELRPELRDFWERRTPRLESAESMSAWDLQLEASCSAWKLERPMEAQSFYPVYRYGDHYSLSPLTLMRLKGHLSFNSRFARAIDGQQRPAYYPMEDTIDSEIVRVGKPLVPSHEIKSEEEFVERLLVAMRDDLAEVEARREGFHNVVLVGGRDSLNLLLQDWRNPVLAVSAKPNYPLVKRFIEENDLPCESLELVDDASLLDLEILANACRNDLVHCRWGPALSRIVSDLDGRAVLWKGQLADTFLTPYWPSYCHPMGLRRPLRVAQLMLGTRFDPLHLRQKYFHWASWHRGAMWQGSHVGMLADLVGASVLGAYHGPRASAVLAATDLSRCVKKDLRPELGERLAGRPIRYPEANPGPAVADFRAGAASSARFLSVLKHFSADLPVRV
jgi:hypothetical protein